ncbi:MAG: hypothetical protein ABW252_13150 [Polyangiales bacterium]
MRSSLLLCSLALTSVLASSSFGLLGCRERTLNATIEARVHHQIIDGFGTMAPHELGGDAKVAALLYEALGASILRVDLTPAFPTPAADFAYNSPWFHRDPSLPGPDGNNVRTYRDVADYSRPWAGRAASIVVMGPDIEANVARLDLDAANARSFGALARIGAREVTGFKLIGAVWSPAPWLKRAHGTHIGAGGGNLPRENTPFPFVWGGNFAGGTLDTSDAPHAAFDDRALGGSGPTSALTQYTRTLAAWLLGFQRKHDVRFYAISLQNELNFETFYNSCAYPRAEAYVKLVKAARAALDAHPELRDIRLMGPEDLLGSDAYALWRYGEGADRVDKNLGYLAALAADPPALAALDLFAIHGYAPDGVQSAGADPRGWRWWARGWNTAPAASLPAQVHGFRAYGKRSWMTETSGEPSVWRGAGENVDASALGLALKIHQALTTGEQSAWLYWQLLESQPVGPHTLTDLTQGATAPKLAAAAHYFRHVRPGARRIGVRVDDPRRVHASAYRDPHDGAIILVLVHTGDAERTLALHGLDAASMQVWTSDAKRAHVAAPPQPLTAPPTVSLPAESVVTVVARPR